MNTTAIINDYKSPTIRFCRIEIQISNGDEWNEANLSLIDLLIYKDES